MIDKYTLMWNFFDHISVVLFATIMWTGHTHLCGNVTYFIRHIISPQVPRTLLP